MNTILRLTTFFALLLAVAGCVSTGPQEVDLTALRWALQRLNERPDVLATLPDTWLDDAGSNNLGCRGNSLLKSFDATYSRRSGGRTDWHIFTRFVVHCWEEDALVKLENACVEDWRRSERIEIVFDELGGTCISPIVQERNQGVIPASSFYSYACVQSGVLFVRFLEIHRWKLGAAKQIAIDDVTSRLLKVLKKSPSHSTPQ